MKYTLPKDIPFADDVGYILRNLLNGVKQDASSFAKLHNLDPVYLEEVMNNKKPITFEIALAVENHPPLNARHLFAQNFKEKIPIHDDTTDGVIVINSEQRKGSVRTFDRGPKNEIKNPYYDYADTAMSKTSLFRPEWIKELYISDGENPDIPDWTFNKGHFEHQLTYYIGAVNLHWIDKNGKKHVRQMNTGDANYGTPFIPHTFSTREEGNGLILAVTYGGGIATEQFQSKIKSMKIREYLDFIKDKMNPLKESLVTDEIEGVLIRKNEDSRLIKESNYEIKTLIDGIPFQEKTKVFEYYIKNDKNQKTMDLKVDSDRWGYNMGDTPVVLLWGEHEQVLEPGSSFFIQPGVMHAFRNLDSQNGKLVVIEIQPSSGDPYSEIALINKYAGEKGLERVHTENTRWF